MDIKILASGSSGNCYLISDGQTNLLLDAGIPIKEIQKGCGFGLTGFDGCLVTHEHNDHAKAAGQLMERSVDVYTSQGTAAAKGWRGHRLNIVKSMEHFNIGTFTVMAYDVEHDSPEPLGFLLYSQETKEKLLYFTDTFYLRYRFDGLTHIMCECNYDRDILLTNVKSGKIGSFAAKRVMRSHMSIDALSEMLKANDMNHVRQIYLLHISDRNGNAGSFKERVQKLTGAEVYAC